MNYKLIAYAMDFSSFLIEKLGKESDKINQVILFGSVSRGEESHKSDIDLFIDVKSGKNIVKNEENFEKQINALRDKFYESMKVKKYWNLIGIRNEINLSIGKLEEWDELQRSMISSGIALFGKFKRESASSKSKDYTLFVISSGKSRNKNISIWRELYGYSQKVKDKIYVKEGLIKGYGGKKLSNGVFIVPAENSLKIVSFLKENKFDYQMTAF